MAITLIVDPINVDDHAVDIRYRFRIVQFDVLESWNVYTSRTNIRFRKGVQQVLQFPVELPECLVLGIGRCNEVEGMRVGYSKQSTVDEYTRIDHDIYP